MSLSFPPEAEFFDGHVPQDTMAWNNYLVEQFNRVKPETTNEHDLYGPFGTLLYDLFPPAEGYQVSPQYNLIPGSIDYAIVYLVIQQRFPIFFVEIKTLLALNLASSRAEADDQMRTRFRDISNTFGHIPLPTLIGISAMGTRFAVYRHRTRNQSITPRPITSHPLYLTNTAPLQRWSYDLMEDAGEAELRAIANEVKEMVLAIGHNCEYCLLCDHSLPLC